MQRPEYSHALTEAILGVVAELLTCLGAYREHMVLVGGIVPTLLLGDREGRDAHVGTADIDLVLDPSGISDSGYGRILEILEECGYRPELNRHGATIPHRFVREFVGRDQIAYRIPVDFLAPMQGGTGRGRRHQRIQDVLARKAAGADLAVLQNTSIRIRAALPSGVIHEVEALVVQPHCFVLMKAITLQDRMKSKDAYDLYYMLRSWPGGPVGLGDRLRTLAGHPLLGRARDSLEIHFESPEALGPRSVTEFLELSNPEEIELLRRDAYELVLLFRKSLESD